MEMSMRVVLILEKLTLIVREENENSTRDLLQANIEQMEADVLIDKK
jgi:hypothetical protein